MATQICEQGDGRRVGLAQQTVPNRLVARERLLVQVVDGRVVAVQLTQVRLFLVPERTGQLRTDPDKVDHLPPTFVPVRAVGTGDRLEQPRAGQCAVEVEHLLNGGI
ncbi:hypothetical protein RLT59_10015 [Streptomyces sp. ITFR-6]|nr:hypothetical protein [Streptomyces sp. ITFR-6]WNI29073.1 hypothetical protein RLT59_10015 [Streptomyces sp. ITFR-6]